MDDDIKYKALAGLISQNHEDNKELISSLEKSFAQQLDFVGIEIRDMKQVIKEHNGRLRRVEIEQIRAEERNKFMDGAIGEIWKEIKDNKQELENSKINIGQLKRVNRLITWMQDHPFNVIATVVFVVTGISAVSAVIRLLIERVI